MSAARTSSNRPTGKRRGKGANHGHKHKNDTGAYANNVSEDKDVAANPHDPTFADFDVPERAWAFLEEAKRSSQGSELELGRVIRLDRSYPLVLTQTTMVRAEHAISLVKGCEMRAAIGDWVVVGSPDGHDKAVIEGICDRVNQFSRWDGSPHGTRQILATNLDTVLAVQPLSKRPLNCDRLVRSEVLAREGGCDFAVILTKADRVDESMLARHLGDVRTAVGQDVIVVVTSSLDHTGMEEVLGLIARGTCALLLGESGAGKSTMVNALVDDEVLDVGAVRERDDQGRHTTVARRMIKIPNAGLLVDAPGLRSLPLLDETHGIALTFPEIDELLGGCRFRDCTHGEEPGCAVTRGVEAGSVDPARLELYRALSHEMLTNRRGLDLSAPASITK